MRTENKYNIGERHVLVDLNKDLTNFKLTFECISQPQHEYQICVTNQNELDTKQMSELVMKDVVGGTISGNIVADSNVYENYFLILRSNSSMEVLVAVDLEPIEAATTLTEEPPNNDNNHHNHKNMVFDWKRIVMVVLLLLIMIALIYYIVKLNATTHATSTSLIDDIANHL